MFLDIPNKERDSYSLTRAIHAQLSKNPQEAPFEYEVSNYIAEQLGQPARGFYMPDDVFFRDLNTGAPTAGGNVVETAHSEQVIPALRDASQVFKLGAQSLDDLVGNVDIPSVSNGLSLTETSENTAATKQDPTFGLVSLSPKQQSVHIDLSRKLVKQSSDSINTFLMQEIAGSAASKIDELAILEILNNGSVPVVEMGTNGATPTWAKTCELEKAVAVSGGIINSPGWLTNHQVASDIKQTEKSTGSEFMYSGGLDFAGHPIGLTSQVPSNLTKGTSTGVCSAMVFGSFDQLIVAQWGAVDVVLDRYSLGLKGGMRLIAWLDVDIGLRQPGSFSVIKDLLVV